MSGDLVHRLRMKHLLVGLKVVVSVSLIYWLLRTTSVADIADAARTADLGLLIVAFGLGLVAYAVGVSRWRLLLHATGVDAPLGFLAQSYMVGVFFNQFLPSTVGGDAVRAYDSWRVGTTKVHGVVVVIMDRLLGLSALLGLSVIGVMVAHEVTSGVPMLRPVTLAVAGAAMTAGLLALSLPTASRSFSDFIGTFLGGPFGDWVGRAVDSFEAFRGRPRVLAQAFGLSLLLQSIAVVQFFVIATSLGFEVALLDHFLIIPVSLLIMTVPLSVNAIGIRENVLVFFFSFYGVAGSEAVALAWIAYGIVVLHGLIGGLIYLLRPGTPRPAQSDRHG